jgi:hypothetical protein
MCGPHFCSMKITHEIRTRHGGAGDQAATLEPSAASGLS